MSRSGGPLDEIHYRMAVPRAWVTFPAEPASLRLAVRSWMLRRLSHLPRDRTVQQRRQVEDQLVDVVRGPAGEYSRQLLVLSLDAGPVPVSATCLVAVLPHAVGDDASMRALAAAMGADGMQAAVEDVGRHRAVVMVRDDVVKHAASTMSDADVARLVAQVQASLGASRPREVTARAVANERRSAERTRIVDVYVPVPDEQQVLALTFSTPLVPLFEAMTELFLAMASTVQFQSADGHWH